MILPSVWWRRIRTLRAIPVLILVLVAAAMAVGTASVASHVSGDCALTPVKHAKDDRGVSLELVRREVAADYATRTERVTLGHSTREYTELEVRDPGGTTKLADVRIQRDAAGDGWLVMTSNACD